MDGFRLVWGDMSFLLQGALKTVELAFLSLLIATALGLLLGLCRVSHVALLRGISKTYVSIIRGTPLYVQIIFFHFGLIPLLLHKQIDPFLSGTIVLSLNAGAYLVEIFRAGIQSIDKGQMEAGRGLGFTHGQTMRYIILPQAVKRMIPAFLNQFIISLKDTSLLAVIGVGELTYSAQMMYSMNYRAFEYLATIGVMYWIIITLLTLVSSRLERRMAQS